MPGIRFFRVSALPTAAENIKGNIYFVINKGLYVCKGVAGFEQYATVETAVAAVAGVGGSNGLITGAEKEKVNKLGVKANSGLAMDETGDDIYKISLKEASSTEYGGIKVGYQPQSGEKKYAVELEGGKAYVAVPWIDTDTHNQHAISVTSDAAVSTDNVATTDNSVEVVTGAQGGAASAGNLGLTLSKAKVPSMEITNALSARIASLENFSATGMIYKGEMNAAAYASAKTSAKQGDVYKATEAITEISAEVGDFVVCKSSATADVNATFDVWQQNLDKATYFGSNSITSGQMVVADGADGKVKTMAIPTVSVTASGDNNINADEITLVTGGTGSEHTVSLTTGKLTLASSGTSGKAGLMSSADKAKVEGLGVSTGLSMSADYKISLKQADNNGTTLGGIKLGYQESGKNYKVQVDANGKAFVAVPWENTTYSAAAGSAITLTGTTFDLAWNSWE